MPKLLIIEDHHNLRESLRIAFEGTDFEVLCAKNGEQGMLYVRNWGPDVVIVDYMLPDNNGITLLNKIRKSKRNRENRELRNDKFKPKIIMLSAIMDEELKERAMAAGADCCMGKPFDLDLLRRMVAENSLGGVSKITS